MIEAKQTGGTTGTKNDTATWLFFVSAKRAANAAATSLIATTQIAHHNDTAAAAWAASVTADITNGGLTLAGTGEENKNLNWIAYFSGTETNG